MLHGLGGRASELKQQGAIQAAQDPNSNVQAADAEKTLVDEAHKSGAAAYHFDPNATVEEKAAAAKAVCERTALHSIGEDVIDND